MNQQAYLVLADGTSFEGSLFGYHGSALGEVVFNTSMTGYQEVLTDPSYCGQIVTFTYPHIGNTGINPDDMESLKPWLSGIVVRDHVDAHSNWRSTESLDVFMKRHQIVGISGIDTRTLTRHLRSVGAMPAIIASASFGTLEEMKAKAAAIPVMNNQDLVKVVAPKAGKTTMWPARSPRHPQPVVVVDFGSKYNIVRNINKLGYNVQVVSPFDSAESILAHKPLGVLLSNGPGDPAAVTYGISLIQSLLGQLPIFGICLGHQLLAHALGGRTFKLVFGHRGITHPVKEIETGRIQITSQNHGFAVDPESLPSDVRITHVSLYDGTVEGIAHKTMNAFSVQFHPEAAAGPHDAEGLFAQFVEKF